ncbi:MAG: DUF692 domain-containing protein [Pseudomonadota bacterium]
MTDVLPPRAGVGLKLAHAAEILADMPDVGWFEVHPETFMVEGGPRHRLLAQIRERYPLSLHGVALSLAGTDPPDEDHLRALRRLVDRYAPASVSEHLAWSAHGDLYFGDLLPVPLTDETLATVTANIHRTQEVLGRTILIENPSHYLRLPGRAREEVDFLVEIAKRTGCGLLLDVENVLISAHNVGYDAEAYLDALPGELIGEIHLAGHETDPAEPDLLIDSHSRPVAPDVWSLLRHLLARVGPKPVLVEWDNDVPAWPVLFAEMQKAAFCLEAHADPERAR